MSRQATDTARRILLLREEHRHLITKNFGYAAGNGHWVLEYLYENPMASVGLVAHWSIVAFCVNLPVGRETGRSFINNTSTCFTRLKGP